MKNFEIYSIYLYIYYTILKFKNVTSIIYYNFKRKYIILFY